MKAGGEGTGLSLRRAGLIATATGFGAGATLLLATVEAARGAEGASPGLAAMAQALGVFAGSVAAARISSAQGIRLTAVLALAVSVAACLLLARGVDIAVLVLGLLATLGLAIGFSVAALDRRLAAQAVEKAASSVLYIGLFAAVGVMVAPLLMLMGPEDGGRLYLAPAAAFGVAMLAWLTSSAAKEAQTPPPPRTLIAAGPLLLLAFLFGFIDNGALSMAPAFFASQGASNLTVLIIGVSAVAGAAIVQLVAIVRAEGSDQAPRPDLLMACLAIVAIGLFLLALSKSIAVNAFLLVIVGVAVDIVYGLGLLLHLRTSARSEVGRAAASYICAAALGETVGPLILDLVRHSSSQAVFFLLPACLSVAGMVVTARIAQRAALARPSETPA